jgi:OFA family oxalate/formate antiporter-like MFS transporter
MAKDPLDVAVRISRFWPFRRIYYGWAVVVAGVFSSFAVVPTQGPIVGLFVQPMRDDLGWSATAISAGFVAGTLSGGVFSWSIGGLLDRHGARVINVLSGIVIAGAMIGLSMMTSPWHFWLFFGIARGVSASGSQLSTMVALAAWFIRKRGRVVGLIGTGQRFGQALLPLPIFAIMLAFSWREAWLVLAGVVVLLQVVPSGLFVRRRPEDYGLLPDGAVVARLDGSTEIEDPEVEEAWTLQEAKRTRSLWLLILAQGAVQLGLNATNLHITAHFQDNGISLGLAALAVTIFAGTSAVSTLPWGLMMEHIHTRYIGLVATGGLAVAMIVAMLATSFPSAVLFALLYGFALGGWTVTSRMLFANYFGRHSFGAIRGFSAPLIVMVNPLGPVLAGVIRDRTGSYDLAFAIFAAMFVVAFLAFLLAAPPKKAASPS